MRRLAKFLLAAVLCIPLLHGCTPARKTVVYSIYPIGWLLDVISGNTLTTESIQDETVPVVVQRAQLKSDYRDLLGSSRVFFHIGGLEPYVAVMGKTISESGTEEEDLSSLNTVYDFQRYREVISDGERTFIESPYYEGEIFQNIDTPAKELGSWNDPITMLSMAGSIRDWLKKTYPENKDVYQQNYEKLDTELINLDAKYQEYAASLTQNNETIAFATMTASFGNWQKTYGFQVYPLILSKYGVLPTAAQLSAIEAELKADGVRYIIYESNMTADMIALFNQVQKDLQLTRVDLSNLSALSLEQQQSGKDYLSIMYENLAQLQTISAEPIPEIN